jgi:hypothetical protein
MRAGVQVQDVRNAVVRSAAWRLSCFCSGSAPRGSPRALHSDPRVNGAIITRVPKSLPLQRATDSRWRLAGRRWV